MTGVWVFSIFYSKESAKPTHVKNGDTILFSLNVGKDNCKASGLHRKSVLTNFIFRGNIIACQRLSVVKKLTISPQQV